MTPKDFYKRIFLRESGCPHELQQVSKDILKKCGGVPLAIVTIASLLASDQHIKMKDQWHALLKSIGHGLTEDAGVEEMQRILSFSYYDLPSHLKTCLLYMSLFLEDMVISRDRLIWMWIAEGFIHRRKQETISLYQIGESCFSDLINRNMIQPLYINGEGKADACRVHDMVLDLICSLSSAQNFATILDGTERSTRNSQGKLCRVSFQNSISELTTRRVDFTSMSQVRSVSGTATDLIQSLSRFQVLRVLDLEGCYFEESSCQSGHIRHVTNLLHLRYLGLRDTHVGDLPTDIGKLRFLQTLDLRGTLHTKRGRSVVSSIVRLGNLMCLYVDPHMELPVGMNNLASLEELSELYLDGSHMIEINFLW
uniref:Uncharacterized protein n=1 Tax=Avena sativa TaxID=4498 RepID=A0ACD5TKY2_AVESA